MAYAYKCSTPKKELNCIKKSTEFNDNGGGNAIYLDRHKLQCGENEALSQFKLVNEGTRYKYDYTCCS